jgi:hypothetical protein
VVEIPGYAADCVELKAILRLRKSIRFRESIYSAQDDNARDVLIAAHWPQQQRKPRSGKRIQPTA